MIKKILFSVCVCFLAITASAAKPPVNDSILLHTIDQNSRYYYPVLFERYMSGDSTLTRDDYYYLYYGFAFQDMYRPLEPIAAADRVLAVLDTSPEPDWAQAMQLISYAREVMLADPFSPRNLNILTYAYGVVGDEENERASARRLDGVIQAINASGNGLRKETPWHILWASHAEDFLAVKGLEVARRRIMTSTVEYISLRQPDGKVKGYYFDYSRVYWKRPENLPERGNSGFMINGYTLKKRKY